MRTDCSDINAIAKAKKLVIDDVVHKMTSIGLAEIEQRISEPHVGEIVFLAASKNLSAADVVSFSLLQKEGILQVSQILVDRIPVRYQMM